MGSVARKASGNETREVGSTMSQEARDAIVASPNTIFQHSSQRSDLLDQNVTNTNLIELVGDLLAKGHIIEFTAIKSDHHDDSALGRHCHFNGFCIDCWPLASLTPGDYLSIGDPRCLAFLHDAGIDPVHYQTGLTPDAYTHDAITAAGSGVFEDDGGSHIHLGVVG